MPTVSKYPLNTCVLIRHGLKAAISVSLYDILNVVTKIKSHTCCMTELSFYLKHCAAADNYH
jgi:hypothetical protein